MTSRRSNSSSRLDTLVNLKAKKAALEKRMKFFKLISEQERKLEQLKMQGEYEEVSAQETVCETVILFQDLPYPRKSMMYCPPFLKNPT